MRTVSAERALAFSKRRVARTPISRAFLLISNPRSGVSAATAGFRAAAGGLADMPSRAASRLARRPSCPRTDAVPNTHRPPQDRRDGARVRAPRERHGE